MAAVALAADGRLQRQLFLWLCWPAFTCCSWVPPCVPPEWLPWPELPDPPEWLEPEPELACWPPDEDEDLLLLSVYWLCPSGLWLWLPDPPAWLELLLLLLLPLWLLLPLCEPEPEPEPACWPPDEDEDLLLSVYWLCPSGLWFLLSEVCLEAMAILLKKGCIAAGPTQPCLKADST